MARSRSGISLTEVLISMGILTIGLLGVMAMFPVGGFYMQRAEMSDRASAIAQSVMNDIVARNMLDPDQWQMLVTDPIVPGLELPAIRNRYARSVGRAIEADYASMAVGQPDPRPRTIAQRYGSGFVIDPLGLAVAAVGTSNSIVNPVVTPFPAEAFTYATSYYSGQHWRTWDDTGAARPRGEIWPIRRVTFHQPPSPSFPNFGRMEAPLAASMFSTADDLSLDLPSQGDRPAVQLWQTSTSGPLERQSIGDYSWIVTVSPTTSDANIGLGNNPESHACDVSVIVFYKRGISRTNPTSQAEARVGVDDLLRNERAVKASVVSRGPNGGELMLQQLGNWTGPSPYENLRTGQWLMVCGPHPASTDAAPRFTLLWYQVTAVDSDGAGLITNADRQRVVALRGPEWPWLPANLNDNNNLSNNLCVGIFPGAVAVHTKTLRLQ